MTARLHRQELPDGWKLTKGGTLFTWSSGKNLTAKEHISGNYPIYGGNGINGYHNEALVEHPTIIIGRVGAHCGNVYITNGSAWITDNAIYAKNVPPGLNLKFIKIAFDLAKLNDQSTGSGQPFVNQRMLNDVSIYLPPIQEQHRIVAAIETQFTRLDAAVAALKRSQANLKRYRAAVLKAACEGRLVPTEAELAQAEGRSYEPASVLLERILAERRHKWEAENPKKKYQEPVAPETSALPELPEGWCWAKVKDVGRVQLGRQRAPQYHSGPYMRPYLRVANVFEDRIDISDVLEMNFEPNEFEKYRLTYGDILLNEGQSPEYLGRPAMYRDEIQNACFQNTLIRFQAYDCLDRRYALIQFRSYMHTRRFMDESQITTNIAHLSVGRFSEIEFPLPPLAEQQRIVAEVERRLSLIDQLEKTIEADLARASRLRQSILKRAFAGQLVPQDPNDEPAAVLLERIQAAKNGKPVQSTLPITA